MMPHLRDPDDRVPELPPWVVADLAAHAPDISPEDVSYGERLPGIVERVWPWREWLQAAVLAGYLPHLDDLQLALRGDFEWWKTQIFVDEAEGVYGDAINAAQGVAHGYREIVAMLEGFIAEAEERAATMSEREPEHGVDPKHPKMWREDAQASRARAEAARQRAASAGRDNENHGHMHNRYLS